MSTNKTLGTEGLGELVDILKDELANAGSSVPTITIALNQVVSQSDPLQIQLTQAQYDALAASQVAVVDATALGFTAFVTAVRESATSAGDLNFYARVLYTGSSVIKIKEYAYSIIGSTKILAQYSGDFYSIPTVTITADNVDQSTGTITLTAEQVAIVESSFIVLLDASIVGYGLNQMYKSAWSSGGYAYFSSVMLTYWKYGEVYINTNPSSSDYGKVSVTQYTPVAYASDWALGENDNVITPGFVEEIFVAEDASATNITSTSTISDSRIRQYINHHLPISINGALCHYMDENTTTNIVRYFTATMNGALVHLNIIEINTSTWVVTFNQVDVGASPNVDQDLTANTCFTLDATAFDSLVSTHTATVASPVFTGLSNAYEFVTIKATINTIDYNIKLSRNDTNKYSGLFFIEDSSHLYELTVYYNGTSVYLRCATVY